MKVIDLMHKADPAEVARIYIDNHTAQDGWGTVETFIKFREVLTNTVGISEGQDQCKVIVRWIDEKWGGPNNDEYHDQYFDVVGRLIRHPETVYSLSMTDWGVWREMEVEDETEKNLSIDELASHVFYEITWFGWPERMQESRDSLLDQCDSFQRAMDGWEDGEFLDKFGKSSDHE